MLREPEEAYVADPSWPRLPPGLSLGQVPGVAVAAAGEIYVLQRGSPPVLCFDRNGDLLRTWGEDEIRDGGGHFVRVDPAGRVWITDTVRHQVLTFTPEGRLIAQLGTRGVAGDAPEQFDRPTDVAFAPSGDVYVSDGYGNSRIKRYSAGGVLRGMWGTPGRAPGQFDIPHALCFDSAGRLYVSDRGNSRVQLFDPDGRFIGEWRVFPYIDGLARAPDDSLIAVTGRANGVLRISTIETEAIRGGGDAIVLEAAGSRYSTMAEIRGNVVPPPGRFNMIHGVAVDGDGTVYVAEVRAHRVQRLGRRGPFRDQRAWQAEAPGASS